MAVNMIQVINPTAPAVSVSSEVASPVNDLNGKVLGLMDNSKPNFDIFLARIEERLIQRFRFTDIMRGQKSKAGGGAAIPFSASRMEEFTAKCDVMVNGMCD